MPKMSLDAIALNGLGMGAFMGMAGLRGMLRRTIYHNGEFELFMWLAGFCGAMLLAAFAVFLLNVAVTLGLKGAVGVFQASALHKDELLPIT